VNRGGKTTLIIKGSRSKKQIEHIYDPMDKKERKKKEEHIKTRAYDRGLYITST